MLTPSKIQALADPIEEIYEHIVDELLVNIGKHITAPTWTHTAAWEIQKLSELGQLSQENAAIINKWIKEIPPAVRETMTETRKAALDNIEKQMERAAEAGYVTPAEKDSTVDVIRDLSEQALERYNLVNTNMLNSSVDMYSQAVLDTAELIRQAEATQEFLNDAAASVATGVETRNQAVRRTIQKISDQGLTGFIDRAGRSWTPEAYVNMVTRTTVHNTAIQSTRAFMQDYNTQVFQVSSHAGARPLCYPYQGKFYSWDNSAGEIELGNGRRVMYEPLNSTSYGEPAGLFGINCGHYPIPIVPGVTIPHGADNIQPPEENDKAYAESQHQRALERSIREAKRVVEMAGDLATPEMKQKVKKLQGDMREFIKETGRTRRYDRESIVPLKSTGDENILSSGNKAGSTANRSHPVTTVDELRAISNSPVIELSSHDEIRQYFRDSYMINVKGFEEQDIFGTKAVLAGYDDMLREFPDAQGYLKSISYNSRMRSYGSYSTGGTSRVGKRGLNDYGTGVHETAHALDDARSTAEKSYSELVLERARKQLGIRVNSRKYRDICFFLTMDPDEMTKPYEVFAYAIETEKAGNSTDFTKAVLAIIKEE